MEAGAFGSTCPDFRRDTIILPQDQFTRERVFAEAKRFLSARGPEHFSRLVIGTNASYLAYYLGKGITESSFQNWEYRLGRAYEEGWNPLQDIAEITAIGGSALLRIRLGSKIEELTLIAGPEIQWALAANVTFLMVSANFHQQLGEGTCSEWITVFLKTRYPLVKARLQMLGRQLQTLSPGQTLFVVARNDSWFIEYPSFPPVYAFDVGNTRPSETQFKLGAEVRVLLQGNSNGSL